MLKQTGVTMSTETDVITPEQIEKTDLERSEDELATLTAGTIEHTAKLDIVNYLKAKDSQELVIDTPRQNTRHKLGSSALRRFFGTRH